jgi:outer membrane lipoprotein-sorting protein
MRRVATFVCLSALLGAVLTAQTPAKKTFKIVKDPKATIIAQTAVDAMGGDAAIQGYRDSLAVGSLTVYQQESPTRYPISLKSKGLLETRVETEMPEGRHIRIMNQGHATMQKPDGTVRSLGLNNVVGERVSHIPLLSLLAEYKSPKVSLTYKGEAQVNGQMVNAIALSFVPYTDSVQGPFFSSITETIYYVNMKTGLVDKMQYEDYEEGNHQQHHRTIEDYFSQYQNISGIAVPFRQVTYFGGKLESELTLSSISFNSGLLDAEFTLTQGGTQQ